jgi:rhodanese-related sulfurtransferase
MIKRVTPKEAAGFLAEGWTYLDVRSVPEFEQGHPQGAANVPLLDFEGGRMVPNARFASIVQANFPLAAKLVVGCKSGGRSAQATALLDSLGYQNLLDVRGGFGGERDGLGRSVVPGWAEEGLPVATQPAPGLAYADLLKKNE